MQFEQYRKEVMVTWNSDLTFDASLVNGALGLAEFGEIYSALNKDHRVDEIGDFVYYLTVLGNLVNMNDTIFDSIIPIGHYSLRRILKAIFEIQAYAKKVCFHKKPFDYDINQGILYRVMFLFSSIKHLCEKNDVAIEDVFDINIAKLRKRHGSSFQYNTN